MRQDKKKVRGKNRRINKSGRKRKKYGHARKEKKKGQGNGERKRQIKENNKKLVKDKW